MFEHYKKLVIKEVALSNGDTIYVRRMKFSERISYEAKITENTTDDELYAAFISHTLCDIDGALVAVDVQTVADWDSVIAKEIFNAAYSLNLVGRKPIEDAKKNSSEATP